MLDVVRVHDENQNGNNTNNNNGPIAAGTVKTVSKGKKRSLDENEASFPTTSPLSPSAVLGIKRHRSLGEELKFQSRTTTTDSMSDNNETSQFNDCQATTGWRGFSASAPSASPSSPPSMYLRHVVNTGCYYFGPILNATTNNL